VGGQTETEQRAVGGAGFPAPDSLTAAVQESSRVTAAVVGVGRDWIGDEAFGHPASDMAGAAECPVLLVHGGGGVEARGESLPGLGRAAPAGA
jgi:nucleotide-binding universal stress UspA family protein